MSWLVVNENHRLIALLEALRIMLMVYLILIALLLFNVDPFLFEVEGIVYFLNDLFILILNIPDFLLQFLKFYMQPCDLLSTLFRLLQFVVGICGFGELLVRF